MFIKLKGMKSLRNFQNHLFSIKDEIKTSTFNELKYLLSILVLNLYKHFKTHDILEVNNNPFVEFNEEKVEGF